MLCKASKPRLVKYVMLLLLLVTFMQNCFGSYKLSDDISHKRKSRYDIGDTVYVRDESDQKCVEGEVIEVNPLKVKPEGWNNAYEFQEIYFGCEIPEESNKQIKRVTENDKLYSKKKVKRLIELEEKKENFQVGGRIQIITSFEADSYKGDYSEANEKPTTMLNEGNIFLIETFDNEGWLRVKHPMDYTSLGHFIARENFENIKVVSDKIKLPYSYLYFNHLKGYFFSQIYNRYNKKNYCLACNKNPHNCVIAAIEKLKKWIDEFKKKTTSENEIHEMKIFETMLQKLEKEREDVNVGSPEFVAVNYYKIEIIPHQNNINPKSFDIEKEKQDIDVESQKSQIKQIRICEYEHCRQTYNGYLTKGPVSGIRLCGACYKYEKKNKFLIPRSKRLKGLSINSKIKSKRDDNFDMKENNASGIFSHLDTEIEARIPYSQICYYGGNYNSRVYNPCNKKSTYLASDKNLDNCAIKAIERLKKRINDFKQISTPENGTQEIYIFETLLQTLEKEYTQRGSPKFISNNEEMFSNDIVFKLTIPYSQIYYNRVQETYISRVYTPSNNSKNKSTTFLARDKNLDNCAIKAIEVLKKRINEFKQIFILENVTQEMNIFETLLQTLEKEYTRRGSPKFIANNEEKEYTDREYKNFSKIKQDGNESNVEVNQNEKISTKIYNKEILKDQDENILEKDNTVEVIEQFKSIQPKKDIEKYTQLIITKIERKTKTVFVKEIDNREEISSNSIFQITFAQCKKYIKRTWEVHEIIGIKIKSGKFYVDVKWKGEEVTEEPLTSVKELEAYKIFKQTTPYKIFDLERKKQKISMTIPPCFQQLDANIQLEIKRYIQDIFQDYQLDETQNIITDELKHEFGFQNDLEANDVYNYFKYNIIFSKLT